MIRSGVDQRGLLAQRATDQELTPTSLHRQETMELEQAPDPTVMALLALSMREPRGRWSEKDKPGSPRTVKA
jgi:hypothetical protein